MGRTYLIESARATPKAHLPYGMFLTRLFRYVMENYPHLDNGIYNVVDQVMCPLSLRQTRKPQSDCGIHKARHSVSFSSTHHYGSSAHQEDDDENEGTSRASALHLLPLILTPSYHSITKNTTFPLPLNKMMIFSSSEKPLCLIKYKRCMRNLKEASSRSEKH
ncbi:hypothetical protein Tco_0302987 [Tanacetum coccineum]